MHWAGYIAEGARIVEHVLKNEGRERVVAIAKAIVPKPAGFFLRKLGRWIGTAMEPRCRRVVAARS